MGKIRKSVRYKNTDDFIVHKPSHSTIQIFETAQANRPLVEIHTSDFTSIAEAQAIADKVLNLFKEPM